MEEAILAIAVITTGIVLIVSQFARLWRAGMQHKTIREAISRDSSVVPDLLAGIDEPQPSGSTDDRTGLVLLALALALYLFGVIQGDGDDARRAAGAALFPAFVGGALLIRYFWARWRDKKESS